VVVVEGDYSVTVVVGVCHRTCINVEFDHSKRLVGRLNDINHRCQATWELVITVQSLIWGNDDTVSSQGPCLGVNRGQARLDVAYRCCLNTKGEVRSLVFLIPGIFRFPAGQGEKRENRGREKPTRMSGARAGKMPAGRKSLGVCVKILVL